MGKPEVQWLEDRVFSINGEEFFDYLFCKIDDEGNVYTYHDSNAAEEDDDLLTWMDNTIGLDYDIGIFPHNGWYVNGRAVTGRVLPNGLEAEMVMERERKRGQAERFDSTRKERRFIHEMPTSAEWDKYYFYPAAQDVSI